MYTEVNTFPVMWGMKLMNRKKDSFFQTTAIMESDNHVKTIWFVLMHTLPKFNIAPENKESQKETHLPTIHFQRLCQTSRGYNLVHHPIETLPLKNTGCFELKLADVSFGGLPGIFFGARSFGTENGGKTLRMGVP